MERPGRFAAHPDDAPPGDAPLSPGEARFDALLEERFSEAGKRRFAAELDAHDREHAPAGADAARVGAARFDAAQFKRGLRFMGDAAQGEVAPKVRAVLGEWLPELVTFAAAHGLGLRDPYQELVFTTRAAYEAEHGALPAGMQLPASSYQHVPLYRRYSIRVVLPDALDSTEALFGVLRALLTRLYGDVFLREEIYPLEAYREDVEQHDARVTVGLAEQVAVLAELPHTTRELEAALSEFARTVGINYKRHPEQARKAWFKEVAGDLERQRLGAERQRIVEDAFAAYVHGLRGDVAAGVGALVEAVVEQDRQLHFLPPDEAHEYARLRAQNPLHFLRSVKLRLEFLVEALGGVVEDFDALADAGGGYPPLAEERIAGCIAELERGNLARPYLVPGVRLTDELERKRNAFPLEVQGIMARLPAEQRSEKQFHTLRKRLEGSLHQRLYNALVLLRHWMRLHDSGREGDFAQTESFQALKGAAANFRFRRPLLQALFVRIGVVLDLAELAPGAAAGAAVERPRFPVEPFARAWGQFVAHALLADYLADARALKGFDRARYWARVEARMAAQAGAGQPGAVLMHLLRRMQHATEAAGEAAGDGLSVLGEVLRQCTPAFRFAVTQALRPGGPQRDAAERLAQLDAWAASVLEARRRSLRNVIRVGDS